MPQTIGLAFYWYKNQLLLQIKFHRAGKKIMESILIPTHLNFAIEWCIFVSNLCDQKTIFELKINTFIHANIIKVGINQI